MQLNGVLEETSWEESSASVAAMYPIDDFSYIIFLLYHSYDFADEHARPVNHYGRRLPASYSLALVSITSTSGWVSAGVADKSAIPLTVATKASIMTKPDKGIV